MVIKILLASRQHHFCLATFSHQPSSGLCHSLPGLSKVTLETVVTIAIIVITHTLLATIQMFVKSQSSPSRCQIISVAPGFNYFHSLILPVPVHLPSHSWIHHASFQTSMEFTLRYIYHSSSSVLLSSLSSICAEAGKIAYTGWSLLSSLRQTVALPLAAVRVLLFPTQSQTFGLRTRQLR